MISQNSIESTKKDFKKKNRVLKIWQLENTI